MKLFVINTTSESSDYYTYVIKHPKKPTDAELRAFMIKHSSDKDDYTLYEYIVDIVEVSEKDAKLIPKVSKEELAKWKSL